MRFGSGQKSADQHSRAHDLKCRFDRFKPDIFHADLACAVQIPDEARLYQMGKNSRGMFAVRPQRLRKVRRGFDLAPFGARLDPASVLAALNRWSTISAHLEPCPARGRWTGAQRGLETTCRAHVCIRRGYSTIDRVMTGSSQGVGENRALNGRPASVLVRWPDLVVPFDPDLRRGFVAFRASVQVWD